MFGANLSEVGVLRTYADAARWEALVKPVRGRAVECKPLGARSKSYANIRKDVATGDIIIRLYSTDIVRYKPDGTLIVNQGGYESQTTRQYLNAVLPIWFSSHQGKTVTCRSREGSHHLLHSSDDNIFKYTTNNVSGFSDTYYFVNPKPCVIHTKNRAKSKEVRSRYAPFINYVSRIRKLLGSDIEVAIDRSKGSTFLHTSDILALAATNDPESHHAVMTQLAGQWCRWGNKPNVLNRFKDIMFRAHRDDIFDETTLPRGELKYDRFKGLF